MHSSVHTKRAIRVAIAVVVLILGGQSSRADNYTGFHASQFFGYSGIDVSGAGNDRNSFWGANGASSPTPAAGGPYFGNFTSLASVDMSGQTYGNSMTLLSAQTTGYLPPVQLLPTSTPMHVAFDIKLDNRDPELGAGGATGVGGYVGTDSPDYTHGSIYWAAVWSYTYNDPTGGNGGTTLAIGGHTIVNGSTAPGTTVSGVEYGTIERIYNNSNGPFGPYAFDVGGGLYKGQGLAGTGEFQASVDVYFGLDPVVVPVVPEPASLCLLGFGAAAVLLRRRPIRP